MGYYRYTIEPLSAFATPLRSDTLYGHLLCAVAEWEGDSAVAELIDVFKSDSPPFRLSSAFPSGFLPMPVLPGIPRARFRERFAHGDDVVVLVDKLGRYKGLRKLGYLPLKVWRELRAGLSQEKIFAAYLEDETAFEPPKSENVLEPHNSIDRRGDNVLDEGGLFFTQVTFYKPGSKLDLYVQSDDVKRFEEILAYMAQTGFGADRTTGKGHFQWECDPNFDQDLFEAEGDWQMNLSVCATPTLTEVAGHYKPFIKHGKVWSGFGESNPFKKPFLAFEEGSVFRRVPGPGHVLQNVHSDPKVVQVTWPLTVPFAMEDSP